MLAQALERMDAERVEFKTDRLNVQARQGLRAFLDDGVARVSKLAHAPVSLSALRPVLAEYDVRIAAAAPRGSASPATRRYCCRCAGRSSATSGGLNLVLGGEWGPGLPPYLAIRHLLDNAGCVADAVGILRDLPLASSRSRMLCDPTSAVYVELLDGTVRLLEPTELVHTNHFLHPGFARHDQLNVFARNSSLLRRKATATGLAAFAQAGTGAGVEAHFELLSQPTICVAGDGDIRRERTVAAVVLLPGRAELHLRPGNPSVSATHTFRLGDGVSIDGEAPA